MEFGAAITELGRQDMRNQRKTAVVAVKAMRRMDACVGSGELRIVDQLTQQFSRIEVEQ